MQQIKDFARCTPRRKPLRPPYGKRLGRRASSDILNNDTLIASENDNAGNILGFDAVAAEPPVQEASHSI
jgi:hypothetical protein